MKIKEKVLKKMNYIADKGAPHDEAIDLTLAEVGKVLKQCYQKCEECYNTIKKEQMKQDFHQRMDEICLIYSSIFDVSVNQAKQKLGIK